MLCEKNEVRPCGEVDMLVHTWLHHERPLRIERETCDLTSRVAGLGHSARLIGRLRRLQTHDRTAKLADVVRSLLFG